MEFKRLKEKGSEIIKKNKYVILILIVGILFMVVPTSQKKDPQIQLTQNEPERSISDEISEAISLIEGVGKAQVVLTIRAGEQTIYQVDEETIIDGEGSDSNIKTVLVTNGDRAESGLIQQTIPPQYLGAMVICQGADSPSIRLAVTEAVSKLTGLKSNEISVLKMK